MWCEPQQSKLHIREIVLSFESSELQCATLSLTSGIFINKLMEYAITASLCIYCIMRSLTPAFLAKWIRIIITEPHSFQGES